MRKLIAIVVILSGLYGGYWFVGHSAVENGLARWFEDRRADGWVAEYSRLNTAGFPSRFDTTITDLELADPETGLAWSAPRFQILALSYQPQHYIAIWPEDQTIANPRYKYAVHADNMRASVVFVPGLSFTLDHSAAELDNFSVTRSDGAVTSFRKGRFGTRRSDVVENGHDIAFEVADYKPDTGNLTVLDPNDTLPDEIDGLRLDMTIGFDAPWDRSAIEERRPQPTSLDLKIAKATWGQLDLELAGSLKIDAGGVPEGEIRIRAQNWREIIELLVNMRVLPPDYKPLVERGIAVISAMSGDPNHLDAPLTFSEGRMSFGPIPLGRAPLIRLR